MDKKRLFILVLIILVLVSGEVMAQGQRRKRPTGKKPVVSVTKTPQEPVDQPEPAPQKKNIRDVQEVKPAVLVPTPHIFTHFYEFSQRGFVINRVIIRHGDDGIGDISFSKKDWGENVSDPLQLSKTTLDRLRLTLAELDFINSTESYQYEKDYSHLGNVRFTLKVGDKSHTTVYNWTLNKSAKALADEYRRISNQSIWMFDIGLARTNMPLDAPKLMSVLDSYISRNEISDPEQMIPLLRDLSNDERIPLMARNYADRIIKQIEKQREKAKN